MGYEILNRINLAQDTNQWPSLASTVIKLPCELRAENFLAVIRLPFILEAGVRSQARPCGICGGQIGTGLGLSSSTSSITDFVL